MSEPKRMVMCRVSVLIIVSFRSQFQGMGGMGELAKATCERLY